MSDVEDAAKYNIPQEIRTWKKEIESEIESFSVIYKGKKHINLHTAHQYMRICFTKGFKVARRNRNALAKYLLSEMEKQFIVKAKMKVMNEVKEQ